VTQLTAGKNGAAGARGATGQPATDSRLENLLYAIQLGQGIGSLRFVPALEAEFRDDHAQRNLRRMRWGFCIAIALYLVFLLLRLQVENGPSAAWGLALRSTIIGTLLATVLISYTRLSARMTPFVMLTYVVFGVGVTAIECVAHYFQIDRRYEGLIFISIHCYVLSGLLFRQACATTLMIFLSFAVGGWLGGLAGKQWGYELLFLFLINVLGAAALYLLEYSDRENFLRRHIIRELAIRDGLTALFNRTAFVEHCERVLRQAAREQKPVALLIFDLDYFKQYNDEYGHLAGDECLRSVAAAVGAAAKRPLDMLARYGGEEFVGIWYEVERDAASQLAETIRQAVAGLGISHAKSSHGRVTVSVGAVELVPQQDDTAESLIKQADEALYEAKRAGRNRAVVRSETPELLLAAVS
jgi:diguanylate cyclase (GGDEF)-like protein